jgi:hypothetical protein
VSAADDENFLDEEAKADAAPVDHDLVYRSYRKWGPRGGIGAVSSLPYPIKLKWPKKQDAKTFFARLNLRQHK